MIKEFDREIKDEEGRNPPEVNKQLNDEKQSMVSAQNLSVLDAYVEILHLQSLEGMQYLQCIVNLAFMLMLLLTSL